ncbi:MAG: aspartate kinase [Clostridia bacterium]|nr:aspartate kinase [Clostridia bacterium]
MITVTKFGGSSVATAEQFKKIKNIIDADERRKVVVVSAPGKRFSGDSKVTDLLYLLSAHIRYGVDYTNIAKSIQERYEEIRDNLNLSFDVEKEFNKILADYKQGAGEEYLISRGEYLCAKLMAIYLGFDFVDAKDVMLFNYDGTINNDKTIEAIKSRFDESKSIVVPGFYGSYPTGEVMLFSRGGSDISGSIMAMGVGAVKYENWTDVSGLHMTDPKIVKNPCGIEEITYDELRELSYMGASVLHEETIYPIKDLNIPIYIKNTNAPEHKGTKICKTADDNSRVITGIAGKKNFTEFNVVKKMTAKKITVIRDALNVFEKFKVNVEHIPTSIDSFGVIVESKAVEKIVYDIILELKKINGVTSVEVDNNIALVAVVGRNMVLKPGISGSIFSIFGNNNINIKTIAQSTNELSIIVGVANQDFEKSIQAVYDAVNN